MPRLIWRESSRSRGTPRRQAACYHGTQSIFQTTLHRVCFRSVHEMEVRMRSFGTAFASPGDDAWDVRTDMGLVLFMQRVGQKAAAPATLDEFNPRTCCTAALKPLNDVSASPLRLVVCPKRIAEASCGQDDALPTLYRIRLGPSVIKAACCFPFLRRYESPAGWSVSPRNRLHWVRGKRCFLRIGTELD